MKTYCHTCQSEVEPGTISGYLAFRLKPHRHTTTYLYCHQCGDCGEPGGDIVPGEVLDARDHLQRLVDQYGHGSEIEIHKINDLDKARHHYKIVQGIVKHALSKSA